MQKLIKLSESHYIVVDDSEIKEGDKIWYKRLNQVGEAGEDSLDKNYFAKIIYSTQPDKGMENVTFISLLEVEEAIYGYNWKAEFEKSNLKYGSEQHSFFLGFKAHKELVKDKLFTLEDMENMFILGGKHKTQNTDKFLEKMNEIIESLLPKTEWGIEFVDGKIRLV